jgi:hypothetical protein
LERLDFIYMPSRDPAADAEHFVRAFGAELRFAIERFDTRVVMVRLGRDAPQLLFAGHLDGERPILVYRVADLEAALADFDSRGFARGPEFEIPYGPGCEIETPGAQRLAIYEITRPEVEERLIGRRDF